MSTLSAPILHRLNNIEVLVSGLDALWAETIGDPRICIALLDGCVDLTHPCFSGANLTCAETLVSSSPLEGPPSVHGTHTASVLFGQPGSPLQGIAPRCRGIIVPIFSTSSDRSTHDCSQLDLARAIVQAANEGAKVINISGGQLSAHAEPDHHLARAIQLCADNRVLIVAAAGNDGCDCVHIPAVVPTTLAVGAMNSLGTALAFSNWGAAYRRNGILAPGEAIPGAAPGGEIVLRTGTSFATTVVSGVIALLLSIHLKRHFDPDPFLIKECLLATALPCEPSGATEYYRFPGKINITGAQRLLHAKALANCGKDVLTGVISHSSLKASPVNELLPSIGISDGTKPSSASAGFNLRIMEGLKHVSHENSDRTSEFTLGGSGIDFTPTNPNFAPISTELPECKNSKVGLSISESNRECGGGGKCTCGSTKPTMVYALGELGYDFGSEARRDSFIQAGLANPYDPGQLVTYLGNNPFQASAVIWTLNQEATPIFAIQPVGAFAATTYERIREVLNAQLMEGVERVSVPGFVAGKTTLLNGHIVPFILPELRGLYSWNTPKLVEAILGPRPTADNVKVHEEKSQDIANFLDRVYYEIRNLGLAPQERAMNFAATNAFQVERVFETAIKAGMKLESITTERSPICRPGSDCWDVKLTFFNPSRRLEQARHVHRFTVDVTDVIPVTIGRVRHWDIY